MSLIRSAPASNAAAATTAEDDPDPTNMHADLAMFEQIAAGYLGVARAFLTVDEIDHLVFATRLIALEQGLRFLCDWLNGDVYYRTSRPDHNLDRARTQFALMREFEASEESMQAIIDRYR